MIVQYFDISIQSRLIYYTGIDTDMQAVNLGFEQGLLSEPYLHRLVNGCFRGGPACKVGSHRLVYGCFWGRPAYKVGSHRLVYGCFRGGPAYEAV